jgi:DNA-binding CsgD family transcriptional regulator
MALVDALERAIEARLLDANEEGTTVKFVHSLVREALYDGILPLRRRIMHGQVGEALAATLAPDPDAVAHHFRQAGDPRAAEWLVRAGERAFRAYAWLAAADQFAAAAALLAGAPGRERERGWLLYRAGRLLRFTNPAAGVAALEEAEDVAASAGEAVLAAYAVADRGALRCLNDDLRRGLAELEAGVAAIDALPADHAPAGGDVATWTADALPPLASAVDTQEPSQPSGGDVRRGVLVMWLASSGRYQAAEEIGEGLLTRVAKLPDHDAVHWRFSAGDAAFGLGLAYSMRGRPEAAQRAFAQARGPAIATEHHFSVGWITARELSQVVLPYAADRLDERGRLAEAAEAALARAGISVTSARLSPRRAVLPLLIVDGRWAEARRLAIEARNHGTFFARQEVAAALATVAAHQGDRDLAWAQIRAVLPEGPRTEPGAAIFHVGLDLLQVAAVLSTGAGDGDAASWLDAADRWLNWAGAVLGRAELLLGRAELHRLRGNLSAAHRLAEEAVAAAGDPRQPLALLAAHRLLGEAATALGWIEDAAPALATATALADACDAPYERGLTMLALSELRAATGRKNEARILVDGARSIFLQLEAEPALARANSLVGMLGPRGKGQHPSGLSVRELEVLRLLAQGLSNPQIAEALFISPRTVAHHVESILAKLGAENRASAVAAAVRRGLV